MIDWDEQWALHAPTYRGGFAHVKLDNGASFRMRPGPGFGDLSHPTTRLMLALMPKKIEGLVIDIGCGSGVLSLAAKCLGAEKVVGIDIDEGAIEHAKSNAALNGLNCMFGKQATVFSETPLILMNMISSEQKLAWSAFAHLEKYTLIVSGFPEEEKEPQGYGALIKMERLEGWKGFIFHKE